jgi:hypothetical protein
VNVPDGTINTWTIQTQRRDRIEFHGENENIARAAVRAWLALSAFTVDVVVDGTAMAVTGTIIPDESHVLLASHDLTAPAGSLPAAPVPYSGPRVNTKTGEIS